MNRNLEVTHDFVKAICAVETTYMHQVTVQNEKVKILKQRPLQRTNSHNVSGYCFSYLHTTVQNSFNELARINEWNFSWWSTVITFRFVKRERP